MSEGQNRAARLEDQKFLTGQGCYNDDRQLNDCLYGYVLRSPHAHADITAIDSRAAAGMAGIRAIFTGEDLSADGIGAFRSARILQAADKSDYVDPPRPLLAQQRVRYVGEPVAFVIADSLDQARDGAEAIIVEYAERPAVVAPTAALADAAPQIWPQAANNRATLYCRGDGDAVAAAFAEAHHVSRITLTNNRIFSHVMEPRSAVGTYDKQNNRYSLWAPTQGVHVQRALLRHAVFDLAPKQLQVFSDDVGGGFGPRLCSYPEHALVLWAARRLGRPVKWLCQGSEAFLADAHARDHVSKAALALDADGRILAYGLSVIANLGAYLSAAGITTPTMGVWKMLTGPYAIPLASLQVQAVFTNTAPVEAYRGAGKPEAQTILERLLDKAAAEIGLPAVDLRRRNLLIPDQLPYRTVSGQVYDVGDFAGAMDNARRRADADNFAIRQARARQAGRLRGFGLACYIHGTGGTNDEQSCIEISGKGRVQIAAGTQSSGQGHATSFAQIVAERLQIAIDAIDLLQGDSVQVQSGGGSGGSSSLIISGNGLRQAADNVIEKAKQAASAYLQAETAALEYQGGRFYIHATDRGIGIFQLAAALEAGRVPGFAAETLAAEARFEGSHICYPYGCQCAEVEIDPETGQLTLVNFVSCDDVGRAINPAIVIGQIHGGIVQGLGQAWLEDVVYEIDSGQLLSGSLMDYCLPRADHLPAFDIALIDTETKRNALNVKGVGECGTIGAPAAFMNAVMDALRPLGIADIEMPATPQRLWRALNPQT